MDMVLKEFSQSEHACITNSPFTKRLLVASRKFFEGARVTARPAGPEWHSPKSPPATFSGAGYRQACPGDPTRYAKIIRVSTSKL